MRVRHDDGGWPARSRAFLDRVRSGDLGSLPVVVGLVIIWTVFSSLNPVFLSPNNLVNLLFDCSTVGVISLGIVCVLMLGEIDLSVGSMSGFASALIGVLWVNSGWPVAGRHRRGDRRRHGGRRASMRSLLNRLGMPSFVCDALRPARAPRACSSTSSGRPARSTCPTARRWCRFGQLLIMPAWLSHALALIPGAVMLFSGLSRHAPAPRGQPVRRPRSAVLVVKALALTVVLEFGVYYLNLGRGVPWMFGLFVAAGRHA